MATVVSIFMHPLVQPVYLSDWDEKLNESLYEKAESVSLSGKPREVLIRTFGQPFSANCIGNTLINSDNGRAITASCVGTESIHYYPLPFFFLGSTFEVVLENGFVAHYEVDQ